MNAVAAAPAWMNLRREKSRGCGWCVLSLVFLGPEAFVFIGCKSFRQRVEVYAFPRLEPSDPAPCDDKKFRPPQPGEAAAKVEIGRTIQHDGVNPAVRAREARRAARYADPVGVAEGRGGQMDGIGRHPDRSDGPKAQKSRLGFKVARRGRKPGRAERRGPRIPPCRRRAQSA